MKFAGHALCLKCKVLRWQRDGRPLERHLDGMCRNPIRALDPIRPCVPNTRDSSPQRFKHASDASINATKVRRLKEARFASREAIETAFGWPIGFSHYVCIGSARSSKQGR